LRSIGRRRLQTCHTGLILALLDWYCWCITGTIVETTTALVGHLFQILFCWNWLNSAPLERLYLSGSCPTTSIVYRRGWILFSSCTLIRLATRCHKQMKCPITLHRSRNSCWMTRIWILLSATVIPMCCATIGTLLDTDSITGARSNTTSVSSWWFFLIISQRWTAMQWAFNFWKHCGHDLALGLEQCWHVSITWEHDQSWNSNRTATPETRSLLARHFLASGYECCRDLMPCMPKCVSAPQWILLRDSSLVEFK
jgi:hypothetical protein